MPAFRARFWTAGFLVVVCALFSATGVRAADGDRRIALVMGNGGYAHGSLPNPVSDANLIADALEGVGFDVTKVTDADQREMKRQIVDFGERLAAAGPTAVGLFYYAGHGVQANGANYLIPIGANLRRVADLDIEAVEADWALLQMREAGNAVNFLILDACRNNPLPRGLRASISGLARMNAPVGTFVAYATSPGATAEDGAGDNSPYTQALVEMLTEEGLAAEILFRNVRNRVIELTEGRQVPWDSSSLRGGDFCFADCRANTDAAPGEVASSAVGSSPSASAAPSHAVELAYWNTIKDSTDPASFEAYLADFPSGQFMRLANLRLNTLQSAAAPEPVLQPASEPVSPGNTVAAPRGSGAGSTTVDDSVQAVVDVIVGRWTGSSRTLDLSTNTWSTANATVEVVRTGPFTDQTYIGSAVSTTSYQGLSFASDVRDNTIGLVVRVEGRYSRVEGPDANGDFETEAYTTVTNGSGLALEAREVMRLSNGVLTSDTYLRAMGSPTEHVLTQHSELRRVE